MSSAASSAIGGAGLGFQIGGPWGAAIGGAAGLATGLLGGGRKRNRNRRAIAELRASQPVGYLTPEDLRAAELTRGRLNEGVQAQGRLAGYEEARRARARGLAGSPSEERALARIGQQTALGAQGAGNAAEEQLYNIRTGREAYQRQKDLAIFAAETGQAQREQERQQAEQGAFWNSLNEFMPTILSGIAPGGGGSLPNPAGNTIPGYDPSAVPKL